jgi:hypothetical protein
MVEWRAVPGEHGGWTVQKVQDGHVTGMRARFGRLSCVGARVLAHELNEAYRQGQADVFTSSLGD